MAKKTTKKPKVKPIGSWQEADEAVQHMARLGSKATQLKAEYNAEEQRQRGALAVAVDPLDELFKATEKALKKFCTKNREEFEDPKHRKLTHGTVGFRFPGPKISIPKGIDVIDLIKKTKNRWRFIRTEETVNKDAILTAYTAEEINDDDLRQMGVTRTNKENFYCDIDLAVEES